MLVSPQLEARYFFLVIRLMIIQCKNTKKKQSIRAEKAGIWLISWTPMKRKGL
ncbi:hypothetical protein UlMin_003820, partial [Ulmus minor]